MSTADVFMSSPARSARFDSFLAQSSSPDLPSLNEIFRKSPKRTNLRSSCNAAPVSAVARSTFMTAASLLREAPEIDIETEQITYSPPRKAKPVKKSAAKAKPIIEKAITTPDEPIEIGSSPTDKPWQKFKGKKPAPEDGQQKIPKGRVTKPDVKDKAVKKKKKQTETVSKHFGAPEKAEEFLTVVDIQKETAMARRSDWTPPPADSFEKNGPGSDHRELAPSSQNAEASKDVFQSLFDTYSCKDDDAQVPRTLVQPPAEPVVEILKKRKRLELVSTGDGKPQKETSPRKAPAVKKKPRTITELATAPYAMPEINLLAPGTAESLLNYFDSDGAIKALVEHQTTFIDFKTSKAKKTAAKPRKTKKKAGTVEEPILFSPNSALKVTSNQDFVFGTSSQLVMEETPTMLRDLQLAMQTSNQVEDDPFASSPADRTAISKKLWQAGARNVDGDLLDVEEVDLVDKSAISPLPPCVQDDAEDGFSAPYPKSEDFVNIRDVFPPSDEFIDLKDLGLDSPQSNYSSSILPKSHFYPTQKSSASNATQSGSSALTLASSLNKVSTATAALSPTKSVPNTSRPNYEVFTDAQLAKQIKSFGFKPVKKRQAMIALLDQCWTSQCQALSAAISSTSSAAISTTTSLSSIKNSSTKRKQPTALVASAAPEHVKKPRGRPKKETTLDVLTVKPITATSEASPKKHRGRPKKDAAKAVCAARDASPIPVAATTTPAKVSPTTPSRRKKSQVNVVEIADSDDEFLSPSPQTSPDQLFSSPPPLDLSISEDTEASVSLLDPAGNEEGETANLFSRITKAVTSAPRTKDPENPSWHEKMLMFDPIVLEELAAWLNSGELTRVGYDGEVSPVHVKKWCESKSIICLWRVNVHGKERKRF